MVRAHDAVVARLGRRGRPGAVLVGRAFARHRYAVVVAKGQADRARARERFSSSTNFALQAAGAVRALTITFRPLAILVEGQRIEDDAQGLAFRKGRHATQPVAGRVRVARADGSRPSPSAVSHCSAAKALKRLPTISNRPSASRTAA